MMIIVFVTWCILFFAIPFIISLTPLENTMFEDIILYLIMPGILVTFFLEFCTGGAYMVMSGTPISITILIFVVYIGSPIFYLLIAYLIMKRVERYSLNSKTNNGNITTILGSNDES